MYQKCLTYDLESYPNFFSFTGYDRYTKQWYVFEDSPRKNEIPLLNEWLFYWKKQGYKMIGFNNIGYDYPMLHHMMENQWVTDYFHMYVMNEKIIGTPWEHRWDNIIPAWKTLIPQIDLFKIHHFDNDAKRTSLKQLEFVMRRETIEDLPYPPGVPAPEEGFDTILNYNVKDVKDTDAFADYSVGAIELRESLGEKWGKDFTNHNDTKIGKDYFIQQLNEAGVSTHNQHREAIQTHRAYIDLGDCVLPYVQFVEPEFNRVLNIIRQTRITETKGALSLSATIKGFQFDFGLGGIHGATKSGTYESDDEFIIVSADVKSYYPNLSIVNEIFPEHLSKKFCEVYKFIYDERSKHKKGTPENAALKLALNGTYGASNDKYSPFYDPKFTMSITINGQLLLCMLAEKLMTLPDSKMLMMNTDGLEIKIRREHLAYLNSYCESWEQLTGLVLEYGYYKKLALRDCNNYIGEFDDGSIKYKGAYVHTGAHEDGELGWHQNHSTLVIKKAASAAILENRSIREFITNHDDLYDFCSLCKVSRNHGLQINEPILWDGDVVFPSVKKADLQRITRYIVTNTGHDLIKTMPALKRRGNSVDMVLPTWRSKKQSGGRNKNLKVETEDQCIHAMRLGYKIKDGGTFTHTPLRRNEVEAGQKVTICNDVTGKTIKDYDINYEWYINQAEKLVQAVL